MQENPNLQSYIAMIISAYLISLGYFNWKVEFFMECYPFHYCMHLRFNLAWDSPTLAPWNKVRTCSAWKWALSNTFFHSRLILCQLWREHRGWEWSFLLAWQKIFSVDANIFLFRKERIALSPPVPPLQCHHGRASWCIKNETA